MNEEQIQKCKMCKNYDDTWDYHCFCDDCKKRIRQVEE
jgi:hypothetical protein